MSCRLHARGISDSDLDRVKTLVAERKPVPEDLHKPIKEELQRISEELVAWYRKLTNK